MTDLTTRICWELVKKEGDIAVWQKPLNNSCYINRKAGVQPLLCAPQDDPDHVWYACFKPSSSSHIMSITLVNISCALIFQLKIFSNLCNL